jgi:hypothetical protein
MALSLAAGLALGAAAVQGLHAQARPLGYVVGEINITNPEKFAKEFSPLARKALAEAPGYRAWCSAARSSRSRAQRPRVAL